MTLNQAIYIHFLTFRELREHKCKSYINEFTNNSTTNFTAQLEGMYAHSCTHTEPYI